MTVDVTQQSDSRIKLFTEALIYQAARYLARQFYDDADEGEAAIDYADGYYVTLPDGRSVSLDVQVGHALSLPEHVPTILALKEGQADAL